MKVIHVSFLAERYGIGTYLINLLRCQLQRFGYENLAVAFQALGPNMDPYFG
jgi:hypothetical protein